MEGSTVVAANIHELIERQAKAFGRLPALLSPGRRPMTYLALSNQIGCIAASLRSAGIGRYDCVALVLPDGPEMLMAFLGVASTAICAPINPAFTVPECDACFDTLNATAVILPEGESPARKVARKRGIKVFDLLPSVDGETGSFRLRTDGNQVAYLQDKAGPDDIALLLHTSGTTSTAKLVPLTHRNILTGAVSIASALGLTRADRLLNVMQLFHVAGLGLCLASLHAGGSVFSTTGFQISRFPGWLEEADPTWFWASPTMLKELVQRSSRDPGFLRCPHLRFIRVGSSPLSPELMTEAESRFHVPVTTNYGMTEASPQITCNPLPPLKRKPGSVGIEAGSEVRIMGPSGDFLPSRSVGEIVIRGPNVISGYTNNPEANRNAFIDGWFRTGDLGYKDEEGYLFLTGRLKEIINRGGEKVSPAEVDKVLMSHPEIEAAVTFSVPHAKLGEEVAAAIILNDGALATETEIREFVATRLASFKVPRRIIFVKDFPKGPTGKIKRIGLAQKLGLTDRASNGLSLEHSYVAPRNALELQLAKIWEEVLHISPVGVTDDFYELGGYSLLAMELIEEIQRSYGKQIPIADLLQAANVEQQAGVLRQDRAEPSSSALVPIKTTGKRPPLFCVHRLGGIALIFRSLAALLDKDQPLYALQARGLTGDQILHDRIEDMAAFYVNLVRKVQPAGPYFLSGASFGGVVAFEMAHQLLQQGEEVGSLCLFDTMFPFIASRTLGGKAAISLRYWVKRAGVHARNIFVLPPHEKLYYVKERMKTGKRIILRRSRTHSELPLHIQKVIKASDCALRHYEPRVYAGRITLFRALDTARKNPSIDPTLGWKDWATDGVEVIDVPGNHLSLLDDPHVQMLAAKLSAVLNSAHIECSGSKQAV